MSDTEPSAVPIDTGSEVLEDIPLDKPLPLEPEEKPLPHEPQVQTMVIHDEPETIETPITEPVTEVRAAVTIDNEKVKTAIPIVKKTLNSLLENKEIKKNQTLVNHMRKAIDKLETCFDSALVFDVLRDVTRTKITEAVVASLDCVTMLFDFGIWEDLNVYPPNATAANTDSEQDTLATPPPKTKLVDAAVDMISGCFEGEATNETVEMQVIRSMMSTVLCETTPAHGGALLNAIKTIYNVFIFSLSSTNQAIAQASLMQLVSAVFERIQSIKVDVPEDIDPLNRENEPLTLEAIENKSSEEDVDVAVDFNDVLVKDAFLLFRAMTKLSVKPLDGEYDMRSHAVRSKLLSLHIIFAILRDYIDVFTSNEVRITSSTSKETSTFVDSVNQYVCMCIAKNAASPIAPVFEATLEIFWLMVSNLRSEFKREITVFLNEIYFPISELKTSTSQQKRYFLMIIQRLCNDPRALIEFYLNYDCDTNLPNIVEKITDYLTRLAITRVDITPSQRALYEENVRTPLATFNLSTLPPLSISDLAAKPPADDYLPFPVDFALKMVSLKCIVAVLRSLSSWTNKAENNASSLSLPRNRSSTTASSFTYQAVNSPGEINENDNPLQFENQKQRKTELTECIRQFNFKPKRGIEMLLQKGFIKEDTPTDIAKFLLNTESLDKAMMGDYMGEGEEKNIAIMHAFVDGQDFTGLSFVEALRNFLQRFRLPGEGQKIDRYMLKFAERFVDGNPDVFANADTAYVLAYSVIMLNTDLHAPQIKKRMTLQEFIENNAGIDDDKDLPEEYMIGLFNEIANNEIKLLSEQHAALISGDGAPAPQTTLASLFSTRDASKEAYLQVSKEISNKTEEVFKTLIKSQRDDVFYTASQVEHVKSIFENLWMSFLAALTPPFKEYDDLETTQRCLEGLKIAVKLACTYGIDYARASFIGALVQFANLQNIQELKEKNIQALTVIFEVAISEGNSMKETWKDVLTVLSQVERLQLISKGVDGDSVPDVTNARLANPRASMESSRSGANNYATAFFDKWTRKSTLSEIAQEKHQNQHLSTQMSQSIMSSQLIILMDKVFENSSTLNGSAIVDFIKALSAVASEEIDSSLQSTNPRMFSLQKMVDVCYYNMNRIRLEWSPLWAVMGEAFNKIGTNSNLTVVFFAIDSLRQLSVRFLDIEELQGFKFQQDFLKPFSYITQNTTVTDVQEMVLACYQNMIQTKMNKIMSGWKTIFETLRYTARSNKEGVVKKTLLLVKDIDYDVHADGFPELVNVFREVAKNQRFQRLGLLSLESLRKIARQIAAKETANKDLWFPVFFALNDVIMTGDDLEVRSRALNFMFDALVEYGDQFDDETWDDICTQFLFPIFGVLSTHWEVNQFNSHDDLSVWLSTTLIQALRNMIALFTHYFESLQKKLDGYLSLLVTCICQENDTIARIGRSCMQQLITQNMHKFTPEHWSQITGAFSNLFELTTAVELFEKDPQKDQKKRISETQTSRATMEERSEDMSQDVEVEEKPFENMTKSKSTDDLRMKIKIKNSIVVKSVLQLLMIESLAELFENDEFFKLIPYNELTKLTNLLQKSFEFARDFNDDYNLRVRLLEARVVDKLPHLLKQESSSSAVLINALFKLYIDGDNLSKEQKLDLSQRLIPTCVAIVERYCKLDETTQERNINTWRPVIVEILQGYYELEDEAFTANCHVMYDLVLRILDKTIQPDLRTAIRDFLTRVGEIYVTVK